MSSRDISKTIKQAITILKRLYLLLYYTAVAFFSSFSMMKKDEFERCSLLLAIYHSLSTG
ncbi:hypothetical protein CPS_1888 [Colwellia psychrerythraea 34H]|uniref:Uncharacterized protein n=1 Tax=Colwellia psychrerythraea (strain 34H / ATCC BAA-681) TaxID=167879 RepID=Q483Z7_COLP3|nr:hypothetical protein CPS_1888 [Colwellia psychrerythraea 34H]